MALPSAPRWSAALGLALVAGCFYPVRDKIDTTVCKIAKQPFDLQLLRPADQAPPMPSAATPQAGPQDENEDVKPAAWQAPDEALLGPPTPLKGGGKEGQPGKKGPFTDLPTQLPPSLQIPSDLLPSGPVRMLTEKGEALRRQFPPLFTAGPDPEPLPGPKGQPLTLADLQKIGLSNSPAVRQAAAYVESTRGAAIQAGLPPNPNIGFEVDTFGTTGGAGYPGGFIEQVIRTANKLGLARAAATMDWLNAEVALRRAQMDLARNVRTGYFAVLVARENMRMNRLVYGLIASQYQYQVNQMAGGFVNPRDLLFVRALAIQSLTTLVQARNAYIAAWKTLAANMGVPGMPLTQVAGSVDMPVPVFDHAKVLAYVLQHHTDVLTAENSLRQARFSLMLAQVQPIPDVDVRFLVQKDFTGAPNEISPSLMVSMPIPVWNRNQGGIIQAQANVVQMSEEPHRVRSALTVALADAFGRYQSNRLTLALYRERILRDMGIVYQGTLLDHYQVGTAAFTDVVVAQQTLVTGIASYLTSLGAMWQSVVDVTDLIQTNDMWQLGGQQLPTECVPPVPDLASLPRLPCDHPCSPLHDPRLQGGDGTWPPAIPSPNYAMPPTDQPMPGPQYPEGSPPAPPAEGDHSPAPARPARLPDVGAVSEALAPPPRERPQAPPPLTDPQLAEPPPEVPRRQTE
jgi:cobalt-zinc-cadmium efflux system outer membrane protein